VIIAMMHANTAPRYRHQLHSTTIKTHNNQYLSDFHRKIHNHPSGDPTPSRADIDMTKTIVETARPLGITVHDHIIIGKDGHASLKGLRLM